MTTILHSARINQKKTPATIKSPTNHQRTEALLWALKSTADAGKGFERADRGAGRHAALSPRPRCSPQRQCRCDPPPFDRAEICRRTASAKRAAADDSAAAADAARPRICAAKKGDFKGAWPPHGGNCSIPTTFVPFLIAGLHSTR